jgi:phenylpropionate dioxygenase-like ring-hydroxylating dioxygenase large terminal subunit
MASADLAVGHVVSCTVEGDELVAWRGTDGIACVSDARCPHEWTHLEAQGVVDGCELVCLSHFWRFDRTGAGTTRDDVSGRREPRASIRVRTCVERDGALYVACRAAPAAS